MPSDSQTTAPKHEFPCTECSGDAFIGYSANKPGDWDGKVTPGERLCTRCFQRRGGENFFAPRTPSAAPPLAIGQVWKPKTGHARRIIHVPKLPGIHYTVGGKFRHCVGSFEFHDWIERTSATLQETDNG